MGHEHTCCNTASNYCFCKQKGRLVSGQTGNIKSKQKSFIYKIDYVIHGDGIEEKDKQKMYGSAIKLGIYREVPRTQGISTTTIINRVIKRQKDQLAHQ